MDFTDVDFWGAQIMGCLLWILNKVFSVLFSVIPQKSQKNVEIWMEFIKHAF